MISKLCFVFSYSMQSRVLILLFCSSVEGGACKRSKRYYFFLASLRELRNMNLLGWTEIFATGTFWFLSSGVSIIGWNACSGCPSVTFLTSAMITGEFGILVEGLRAPMTGESLAMGWIDWGDSGWTGSPGGSWVMISIKGFLLSWLVMLSQRAELRIWELLPRDGLFSV